MTGRLSYLFLFACGLAFGRTEYRAGVAAVDITPTVPIRLSGYASRTKPSEGKVTDLHAKALVIERGKNQKVVIVTTDLIGLPRSITDVVSAKVAKTSGLDRAQILFNSSHTHTGPYVRGTLPLMFPMSEADKTVIDQYADRLADSLVEVIGRALADLGPVEISVAHGETKFAMNRRQGVTGAVKIGLNPKGPSDFDVPVLRVESVDTKGVRKIKAIVFGYACHNTTLPGDENRVSGDYAGFAQEAIEKANPGATAMFVLLCGADQNPNPRGTIDLARKHGDELAVEVGRVLGGKVERVSGPIKTAFQVVDLDFQPTDRATFEARLNDKLAARVTHAKTMIERIDRGDPIRHYPYPVQAISFGKSFTVVAMGGETLVDYDLRIKKEFPGQNLMVAGYSNDVMAYIPSLRVSKEGGYEVMDSMYYYAMPAPWAESTEERIMATVHKVMARVK